MAFHPDITRKDDVTLALNTANSAVRIASKQLTSNAGTVEIPNADGTSTIMGVGAGDTGVAPWVGDTTAPGKPLGITATSGNGMIVVTWDGTLDGGIPADFARTAILIDGVEADSMTVAGSRAFGVYESGSVHTVSAIAYDDAHLEDGSSAPNASVASDPISITVKSSDIDTSKLGITITKTTVAASEGTHGGSKGDLWLQYDRDPNVAGAALSAEWWWDGTAWQAIPIAMYLDQLAARGVQANSAVIGLLAAGIITSGLFQTASSGARVKMDSSGITGYDSNGSITFKIDAKTGDVSMIGKLYSGDPSVSRVIIDDDYNNIDDPQYVDIDGYVAFESPSSDVSPFIGGTHGTHTNTKYTGTIVTSGVTDSSTPSAASVQINSYDAGEGSRGALISTMNKEITTKNASRVAVHSGSDGQMAALMAYDGTANGNYASVQAYVDSDGNHNVDLVASRIFRVDPLTGNVTDMRIKSAAHIHWKTSSAISMPNAQWVHHTEAYVAADSWSQGMAAISPRGITVGESGLYSVTGSIVISGSSSGTRRMVDIYVNGSSAGYNSVSQQASGNMSIPANASALKLNAGDLVTVDGFQDSGDALSSAEAMIELVKVSEIG